MSKNYPHQTPFKALLLLSVLIHSSVVGFLLWSTPPQIQQANKQREMMNIQLSQTKPEVTPLKIENTAAPQEQEQEQEQETSKQVEEVHAPTHNSESVSSNNQNKDVEGAIVAGGGNEADERELSKSEKTPNKTPEPIPATADHIAASNNDKTQTREIITTEGASHAAVSGDHLRTLETNENDDSDSTPNDALAEAMGIKGGSTDLFNINEQPTDSELKIPGEFLDGFGNLEILSDGQLSDAMVEQPFSESESSELKLVNRYLARMSAQVRKFWINPYKGNRKHEGIIKLQLNTDGHLVEAYVYRSSGHSLLDVSVLDAIRSVPRYDVPQNQIIAQRYYTNLSFHYSSIEEETELMPFERDEEEVN